LAEIAAKLAAPLVGEVLWSWTPSSGTMKQGRIRTAQTPRERLHE